MRSCPRRASPPRRRSSCRRRPARTSRSRCAGRAEICSAPASNVGGQELLSSPGGCPLCCAAYCWPPRPATGSVRSSPPPRTRATWSPGSWPATPPMTRSGSPAGCSPTACWSVSTTWARTRPIRTRRQPWPMSTPACCGGSARPARPAAGRAGAPANPPPAAPARPAAVADEYPGLLRRLGSAGLATGGRAEVSVNPTAVGLGLPGRGEKPAAGHIARICAAARDAGTTVTLDMEDHTRVAATLRILAELRLDFPDLGCVLPSYLRRSADDCADLAVAGSRVRLCKGAYRAPDGVAFGPRGEVDRSYARCLRILLGGDGYPMLATHDPRLIRIAGVRADTAGRAPGSFEYQMLYGVRPAEQLRLAGHGARMRVYVPYGSDWYVDAH